MHRFTSAFVLSRIDYCNMVLAELSAVTIAPLWRVVHAAARLVAGLEPREHATQTLRELHWLLAVYRIRYKLCHDTHRRQR